MSDALAAWRTAVTMVDRRRPVLRSELRAPVVDQPRPAPVPPEGGTDGLESVRPDGVDAHIDWDLAAFILKGAAREPERTTVRRAACGRVGRHIH
ncbi:hypothetical protein [Parafrankia sp. FMc2]|uniref:hypothetical protein n=1 Tax=Parafrankia sp. FMc2 TaxID=3233196 RepID=UPI0034D65F29